MEVLSDFLVEVELLRYQGLFEARGIFKDWPLSLSPRALFYLFTWQLLLKIKINKVKIFEHFFVKRRFFDDQDIHFKISLEHFSSISLEPTSTIKISHPLSKSKDQEKTPLKNLRQPHPLTIPLNKLSNPSLRNNNIYTLPYKRLQSILIKWLIFYILQMGVIWLGVRR